MVYMECGQIDHFDTFMNLILRLKKLVMLVFLGHILIYMMLEKSILNFNILFKEFYLFPKYNY